ncbi:MAG: hypothetical protein QXU11_11965 [Thermoproteota archaeon]
MIRYSLGECARPPAPIPPTMNGNSIRHMVKLYKRRILKLMLRLVL